MHAPPASLLPAKPKDSSTPMQADLIATRALVQAGALTAARAMDDSMRLAQAPAAAAPAPLPRPNPLVSQRADPQIIRHGDWYPDRVRRLWQRGRARWAGEEPHACLEANGALGRLRMASMDAALRRFSAPV